MLLAPVKRWQRQALYLACGKVQSGRGLIRNAFWSDAVRTARCVPTSRRTAARSAAPSPGNRGVVLEYAPACSQAHALCSLVHTQLFPSTHIFRAPFLLPSEWSRRVLRSDRFPKRFCNPSLRVPFAFLKPKSAVPKELPIASGPSLAGSFMRLVRRETPQRGPIKQRLREVTFCKDFPCALIL